MSTKLKNNKKNKFQKILTNFFKNLTNLSNHLEFLFKNKYIEQDFFVEKMYALNELNYKLSVLEDNIHKKNNKKFLEEYTIELNDFFEKIAFHIGSSSIYNIFTLFSIHEDFFASKSEEFNELLQIYDNYFIPTKVSITKYSDELKKNNKINDIQSINIIDQQDLLYRKKKLIDKIDGACIVIYINENKVFLINGLFKKDSLGILKKYPIIEKKNKDILKEIENLDISDEFKEKYLEQLSLKEFIIQEPEEISTQLKEDYAELMKYKSKSLSLIVKEFIKMQALKQRKLLILFLIYDKETQFTAHIIFPQARCRFA